MKCPNLNVHEFGLNIKSFVLPTIIIRNVGSWSWCCSKNKKKKKIWKNRSKENQNHIKNVFFMKNKPTTRTNSRTTEYTWNYVNDFVTSINTNRAKWEATCMLDKRSTTNGKKNVLTSGKQNIEKNSEKRIIKKHKLQNCAHV